MVAHGALPHRDRHLATYETWLAAKLAKLTDDQERQILERFGRWHHARALRQHAATGPVPRGAFLRAKQSTTVTAGLLAWLTEHGTTLSQVTQADIDRWYAGGTTTRALIETFLYWAMNQRLMPRVTVPRRSTAGNKAFGDQQRIAALRRILLDDQIATSVRVTAGLVLVFGQPVNRIAALRAEQVRIDDGAVSIQLAREWLTVPEPFAALLAVHHARRPGQQTAANPDSPWLFPGGMLGEHLHPSHISGTLTRFGVPAQPARTATWRTLVRDAPPSVLAELLGVTPTTAMRHAQAAGADYTAYAALRSGRSPAD